MAVKQTYSAESITNITAFVDSVSKKLSEEEFEVEALVMGAAGASILIKRNRLGFGDFAGLGLESRITMYFENGQLLVTIDHVWTNKLIALILGSVTCGAFTVTSIIGFFDQNSVTSKIEKAIKKSLQ